MTREDLYNGISGICPKYIEEADNYKISKKINWKRWSGIAACICVLCCSTITVLAASDSDFAYNFLYEISPYIAQKLKPVRVSCEDNGIKMEVIAADINGANATIMVSMQDLISERLDETTDLFDSYSIHTPYDQTAGCSLVEYDDETQTAIFMLTIEQMNQKLIPGDKITFSVSKILSEKYHNNFEINQVDLENISLISDLMKNPKIRGWGGMDTLSIEEDKLQLIRPEKEMDLVLQKGVSLTGYGIIDGRIHVQVRYDNISDTDNHGYIYLKNPDGEVLDCKYNVAFWDDMNKDSYEEYVFEVPCDELGNYEIWGEFWTCNAGTIVGDWNVTFPLERE